jgi:hypothetical protein
VERLLGRDNRRVGSEREVDTGEATYVSKWISSALADLRHQVGLELVQVDVERTIETEGCGDRRYDLGNEPVQVGVRRRSNAEVAAADLVDTVMSDDFLPSETRPTPRCQP